MNIVEIARQEAISASRYTDFDAFAEADYDVLHRTIDPQSIDPWFIAEDHVPAPF